MLFWWNSYTNRLASKRRILFYWSRLQENRFFSSFCKQQRDRSIYTDRHFNIPQESCDYACPGEKVREITR